MTQHQSIPKEIPKFYDLNYEVLREEGLKYIEELGSRLWTDYNTHDPGITMLEMLCYAITDLGYRTAMPVEDLLVEEGNELESLKQQFFTARQLLSSCPVTANDYRKLLIHVEGVKNAWLKKVDGPEVYLNKGEGSSDRNYYLSYAPGEKVIGKPFRLQGFYALLIEPDPLLTQVERDELPGKVERVFHLTRNLCEDLDLAVEVVPQQDVAVCAEMELEAEADPEKVNAQILFDIQEYLTPPVRYYSLKEMQKKGRRPEEIFEGPVSEEILPNSLRDYLTLNRGFIEEQQLKGSDLGREIRTSDILRIMMDVSGVKVVKRFLLKFCEAKQQGTENQTWSLKIKEGCQAKLCPDHSVFRFYKDVIPIDVDEAEVLMLRDKLYTAQQEALRDNTTEDLPIPIGEFMDVGHYSSVQNQFPDNYGINPAGLPGHASEERKAQARQLKAYLLFFDQILANYFAQLENAKELLKADDSIRKTYFSQLPTDIKDMGEIYFDHQSASTDLAAIMEQLDPYPRRKQGFLDHLLARFGEQFTDYAIVMYQLLNKSEVEEKLIHHKVEFLNDYPVFSASRARAYDHHPDADKWDTENVSGLERRLARLIGLDDFGRKNLSGLVHKIEEDDEVFSWRLEDTEGKTWLESSRAFETGEEALENLFEALRLARNPGNYRTTEEPPWQFVIEKKIEVNGNWQLEDLAKGRDTYDAFIDFLKNGEAPKGMFLIEHILLRPTADADPADEALFLSVDKDREGKFPDPLDPYSFRVTIVLPGWTSRFASIPFRQFFEKRIRMELPAHIMARICWIGREQMLPFEIRYQEWLKDPDHDEKRKGLLQILRQIHSIYPEGYLQECAEATTKPIIINRTHLGNL